MSTCAECAELREIALRNGTPVRPCAPCLTSSDVTADPCDEETADLRRALVDTSRRLANAEKRIAALEAERAKAGAA